MKLINPAHPSEILLDYFLDSPDYVVSSGKSEYIKALITNKTVINTDIADILANVFQTSVDYWLNLQKQYDQSLEELLEDMSQLFSDTFKAAKETILTGTPSKVLVGYTQDADNKELVAPVYMITEQAYKYLVSKCTTDEAWDLGWLGQSEKHAVSKPMPKALVGLIQKHNNT